MSKQCNETALWCQQAATRPPKSTRKYSPVPKGPVPKELLNWGDEGAALRVDTDRFEREMAAGAKVSSLSLSHVHQAKTTSNL